jgi:hypothetical protein
MFLFVYFTGKNNLLFYSMWCVKSGLLCSKCMSSVHVGNIL